MHPSPIQESHLCYPSLLPDKINKMIPIMILTQILTHLDVMLLPLWRVGLMWPSVVVFLSDIVDTVDKVPRCR